MSASKALPPVHKRKKSRCRQSCVWIAREKMYAHMLEFGRKSEEEEAHMLPSRTKSIMVRLTKPAAVQANRTMLELECRSEKQDVCLHARVEVM